MVTAVVLVGAAGEENVHIGRVQAARHAATRDLLRQLAAHPEIGEIILATPELSPFVGEAVDRFVPTEPGPLHVGQQLAALTDRFQIERLLYFGGGAAPLLTDDLLAQTVQRLLASERLVITNNQFASDWMGMVPAAALGRWVPRLPRDNMLGWVLSNEAKLPLYAFPESAATRLDIDTPIDLLALTLHPQTKSQLRDYLGELALPHSRLRQALHVLATPASHVFISGRLGPAVWMAINRVTHSWLRVLAEERGMVSSGRQERGEVYSLLARHIEIEGLETFFDSLSTWADAAFIDTRVLLAHRGIWPDAATRFASDLGALDDIEDPWLRTFTRLAMEAPLPVILGGHGLVAGAMLAFCEILAALRR